MPFATYLRRTTGGLTAWCAPKSRRSTRNLWFVEAVTLASSLSFPAGLAAFFGAGTTGLVADQLQRNCIGIELNPTYAEMALSRINSGSRLFCQASSVAPIQQLSASD